MKVLTVVFVSLFVTIPSLIYSVSNWAFTVVLFPILMLHQLLMGKAGYFRGGAQRIAIGSVFLKIVSPLFLTIVVPIILYMAGWFLIAWIFGGWMIVYFVIRRWSGVSQRDPQGFKAYKSLLQLDKRITKGK